MTQKMFKCFASVDKQLGGAFWRRGSNEMYFSGFGASQQTGQSIKFSIFFFARYSISVS